MGLGGATLVTDGFLSRRFGGCSRANCLFCSSAHCTPLSVEDFLLASRGLCPSTVAIELLPLVVLRAAQRPQRTSPLPTGEVTLKALLSSSPVTSPFASACCSSVAMASLRRCLLHSEHSVSLLELSEHAKQHHNASVIFFTLTKCIKDLLNCCNNLMCTNIN